MIDEKLKAQLNEIIAINQMLLQDETDDRLWGRLKELRDEATAELDRRYGDLFRLLAISEMILVTATEGDSGFTAVPYCYVGHDNELGNGLHFDSNLADGISSCWGKFMDIFK